MLFIHDDDFLTEQEIQDMDRIFNDVYNWTYCNIIHKYDDISNIKYFTSDPIEGSPQYEQAQHILNKMLAKHGICHKGIQRIKFNMTGQTEETITATPHRDINQDHLIFLYYVNDAYGDTILYDGYEIKDDLEIVHRASPKRGSAILFDGSVHAWQTPDKGPIRQVINIAMFN